MISVIIPIYNEEKGIAKCINTILPQLQFEDEIIVVSSGSTDKTIEEVMKIPDERVRLIVQKERKGKASAINLAVRKAKWDTIVQTDGDIELDFHAIEYLIKPLFEHSEIGAVSGRPMAIIPESNFFYDWTQMSYRKIHDIRVKENKEGTFWHMSGYLLAFRKWALGTLPEDKKGAIDAWMGSIIKENGWKIVYTPEAIVHVKAPTTIKDFIAQKARVRAGYALLPKGPRTAQSEIKSFPGELLKIKIWRWPKFIACGFIYAWTWIKGNKIKNKSLKEIWKVPESTK